MNKYWLIIFSLLMPVMLSAKDFWHVLDQISYSAVTANFIGKFEISIDHQHSDYYKVYFRRDDSTHTIMKIIAMGKNSGEIIKTDSHVDLYADNQEDLLKTHFINFNRYPNFLPSNPSILKGSYILHPGKLDKIANKSCQWYWLSPRDNKVYYSIGFCADQENYFPLTYVYKDSATGKMLQRIKFIQITYRTPSDLNLKLNKQYRFSNSMKNPMFFSQKIFSKAQVNDDFIRNLPDNFYIIFETDSTNKRFRHYYLSNGLVYLSLFIQPLKKSMPDTGSSNIQIKQANIYGPINQMEYTNNKNKIILIGNMSFSAMKQFILETKFNY